GKHCADNQSFIAIDGEAIGESGYHLLAASTGASIENRTEQGLSSLDCIRFLLKLREDNPHCYFIGFALGYDCEHWIRDLGPKVWRSLRDNPRTYITIDKQVFTLEYIP